LHGAACKQRALARQRLLLGKKFYISMIYEIGNFLPVAKSCHLAGIE
jgi:hypothetical protein